MTPGQLLDAVRDHYLERLRAAAAEHAASGAEVILEPVLRGADGAAIREGALDTAMRVDLVAIGADGEIESLHVQTETMVGFEPFEFEWDGATVRLAPFTWDDCPVRLEGLGRRKTHGPLRTWFGAWFDEADARPAGADGLRGVVHFVSDPARSGTVVELSVDLGSAPVEAFEQLLDAGVRLGATKITVGAPAPARAVRAKPATRKGPPAQRKAPTRKAPRAKRTEAAKEPGRRGKRRPAR